MKIRYIAKVTVRCFQTVANIRSLSNGVAGVFYDWDGTLIKFRGEQFLKSMNAALSMFGYPEMSSLVGSKSIRDTLKTEEALDAFRHHFSTHPLSINDLMPGALELIKTVNSWGLPQGIVSNLDHKVLIREIGTLGLSEYFSVVIGSRNDQHLKPNPAMLFEALSAAGIIPSSSILYVGDSPGDIIAAKAASCASVFVGNLLPEITPDFTVPHLYEIGSIITGALTTNGDLNDII